MNTQLLDATALPPAIRHARIFEIFDALRVGESFVLENDHYPLPLLYQFQIERPGQFEWSVLAFGPAYRIEIHKRDAFRARAPSEYLTWDHRRLDAMFEETAELVADGKFDDARGRFSAFACGLARHIDAEEKVLFPHFEERVSHPGPIHVMTIEHQLIHEALRAIDAALAAASVKDFEAATHDLVSVLGEHNAKEERVLYPIIDEASSPEERVDLVKRMQALRQPS
jgi:uncharacterized protein (DUF2249 family)/hemerythrin-like domain-containing protein